MWQTLLITLLQVWVSILEGFLASKTHTSDHDSQSSHHNNSNNAGNANGSSPEALLHKAYEVLELTPPFTDLGMDEVRQQWKKLSRRYHPDRNQGSEESKQKQQEINEAMDRIQIALEQGGGGVSDPTGSGDGNHEEEHDQQQEHENFPMPPSPPPPEHYRRHTSKKQQRREERIRRLQYEKELREYQQKIYTKMKKEMRKERDAYMAMMKEEMRKEQEQRNRVNQEMQKIQRETSRLGDLEQRQASSQIFMNQVERIRRGKEAQEGETGHSEDTYVEKPKNYIMESCTNRIVVAMRLGMEELAVHMLDDAINEFINDVKMQPYNHTELLTILANGQGIVSYQQLLEEAIKVVILKRLDEDNNSLLHYAVYWECESMIRCVCDVAHHSGLLEEVFCAKNLHDNVPMELAWIAKNPDIMPVLQSYQSLVQLHRERTHLGPATVKAIKQLAVSLRTNFDLVTVGNTILAYYTGRVVVGLHWVWACLGIVALQCPYVIARILPTVPHSPTIEPRLTPFVTYLLCIQFTWLAIRGLLSLVTLWQLYLLLIPVSILLCGGIRLWSFPMLIWTGLWAMLIYHPLMQIEESVFRPAWSTLPKPFRRQYDLLPTVLMVASLLVRTGVILHWADVILHGIDHIVDYLP